MYKEYLDKLNKHWETKPNFEGGKYITFIKSLDIFERYKIYIHQAIKIMALNTEIKPCYKHPIPDFFEWTYEEMANYYWKFKDEIKLNK